MTRSVADTRSPAIPNTSTLHLSSTAPRFGTNKQAVALVPYPFRGLYLDPVGDCLSSSHELL